MKKSLSILVIVFLFVAVLRLTSITYGYYSTRVIENKNENSLSIVSKVLKIEYEDGTSIMNFKGDYIFPGDSAEKLWSVKNTGTDLVSYNVLVENVSNNFERIQDLRYVLYINNEEVSNGAINNNLKQYLFTNKEINAGATDSIKLVFVYDETEEIQNADMNKTISFKVNIDTNTVNSAEGQTLTYLSNNVINNYRIYGKSLQETIPNGEYTPIYSVGDLVTDETSEYYGKYKIPIKINNVETNIYLDEPLRGIGDYADYIDFKKQSVVRRIKKHIFDGSEQLNVFDVSPYRYIYYVLGGLGEVINDIALSSHFELQPSFSYLVEGSNKFRVLNSVSNNQSRIVFRIVDEIAIITDVSKVKTLFQDAFNEGRPYTFYYASSEVEEKYINIPKLTTFDGTNIIEVNTSVKPSNLYLEYYKKGE